jgi:hypothetical protein
VMQAAQGDGPRDLELLSYAAWADPPLPRADQPAARQLLDAYPDLRAAD